jgi:hypothetical protein
MVMRMMVVAMMRLGVCGNNRTRQDDQSNGSKK